MRYSAHNSLTLRICRLYSERRTNAFHLWDTFLPLFISDPGYVTPPFRCRASRSLRQVLSRTCARISGVAYQEREGRSQGRVRATPHGGGEKHTSKIGLISLDSGRKIESFTVAGGKIERGKRFREFPREFGECMCFPDWCAVFITRISPRKACTRRKGGDGLLRTFER